MWRGFFIVPFPLYEGVGIVAYLITIFLPLMM